MFNQIVKIFLLILLVTSVKTQLNIKNIIKDLNTEIKSEINIIINFEPRIKHLLQYDNILHELQDTPKLIITNRTEKIFNLNTNFNKQSLTIA